MTNISIPQQVLNLSAKEKNLVAAWERYVDVNKRHINRTLLINESRAETDKELAFPLALARKECGKVRITGKPERVWDIFFPIYPFFEVAKKGSSFTGKMSQIIFPDESRLKEIQSETTILEKYFPEMTEAEIGSLPMVPIDLQSLGNYIKTTQSYDVHPDLSEPIKDANREHIKQAQAIVDIVNECQTLGITTKPMLPYKTKESLFGRTYHLGINLQSCKKHIRQAALGKCWEYDLNGAVVAVKLTLMEKIYDLAGEDMQGLFTYSKQYLDEKDEIRQQLADVLHNSRLNHYRRGLTSEPVEAYALTDIKQVFTAISFGADITRSFWFDQKSKGIRYSAFAETIRNKDDRKKVLDAKGGFLRKFVDEQKSMTEVIVAHFLKDQEFKDQIDEHPETFGKSRLSKPTVMACIYQRFEAKIIDLINEGIVAELNADPLSKDKSSPIILKVHDGFYSRRRISKGLLQGIIDKIQHDICKNAKGFITMSENAIKPWAHSPFVLAEYEWKKQKAKDEKDAKGYLRNGGGDYFDRSQKK